jgi:ribosomal protein S18 acetylase RimI-like enzyme
MEIRVREFNLQDAKAIGELHSVVEGIHRAALPLRFRKPPIGFLNSLLEETISDKKSKLFIAESGNEALGYVRVMIKEMPDHPMINPGKFISVEELVVAPKARRMGVGKALMELAERFASDEGFSEIELNVWKFNESAEKFYLDLGYLPARTYFSKKIRK